ncbi:carbohydrate ABC transporter permease [Halanaerobium sp. Z-7514]|uniref:Carbohydrate ABC transporter permease n=1 Tax=Halanaerobium polyolivorans TaxID=2886943 RepID=A0AAW4X1B4_9FIRM|nr:carbohydrate ABC transporter permease [Halanaerobium polyolivorans]MCC3145605.1 carbohydrate ABC transporter permease [Halanaerobium polyolivorans]
MSIKPDSELYSIPIKWIPSSISFQRYVNILTTTSLPTYIKNSLIVATTTTLICIIIGSMAAYSLARLDIRGKKIILSLVLAISMFPAISIVSPLFLILRDFGLLNSYLGLIIPYTTFALPLTIFILTSFFRTIPFELEEAARVDGATYFQAFIKIILPLVTPGMFTTAILVFIRSWNEYLFALTFNMSDSMRTVPVGLTMFQGEFAVPWGDISAATIIVTIPLIIGVLIFQRRIISGLTAGSVKG